MSITCASCGHQNTGATQFCANPSCGAYLPWDRARQPGTIEIPVVEQRAGLRVELAEQGLVAEPGQTVGTAVTVHNTGTRVEQFKLRLFGPAAVWGAFDPAELAVYPGTKATCVLSFSPPRSASASAGRWDFGVLVESSVNQGLRADASGWVMLGSFSHLTGELWPQVTRGAGTTEHSLILDNQGNVAEDVKLSAADDSGELRLELPATVTAGPGRTFVPIKVTAANPGAQDGRTFRFTVTATPRAHAPIVVHGSRAIPAKPQPQPRPQPLPPPQPRPRPEPAPKPQPQVVIMQQGKKTGCFGGFVKLVLWLILFIVVIFIIARVASGGDTDMLNSLQHWLEGLR